MVTPTPPLLRPLSLGELLDRAIRLYRHNWLNFVGIIAIVQIPLTLLSLLVSIGFFGQAAVALQSPSPDPAAVLNVNYFIGTGATLLLSIANFVLVQGVATAALTRSVADHYLGQPISFIDAYFKIGNTWKRLIGAILLALLITIGLGIWTIIPCVGWLTGIGLLLFFSAIVVPMISPIIILEKRQVGQAILRAWDLARRRFWWVVGFFAALILFAQVVVTGPNYLLNLALNYAIQNITPKATPYMTFALKTIGQSTVSLIFNLLYMPLQLTCLTLMYFDLRVRTEGFDMALLASSTADEHADLDAIAAQAPLQNTLPFLSWTDAGQFMLLTIAFVVIWAMLFFILGALGISTGNLL